EEHAVVVLAQPSRAQGQALARFRQGGAEHDGDLVRPPDCRDAGHDLCGGVEVGGHGVRAVALVDGRNAVQAEGPHVVTAVVVPGDVPPAGVEDQAVDVELAPGPPPVPGGVPDRDG